MHYFGPTETLYQGDPDDIHPTEEEIRWLVDEANHLLPALNLKRSDVMFAWAEVRPLTYDPALPKGKRSREVHDLSPEGLPNVLAMTAGPMMTHRSAGAEMVEAVRGKIAPIGPEQPVSYAARRFPENQNSPPLLNDYTSIKMSDLRHAAEHEQVDEPRRPPVPPRGRGMDEGHGGGRGRKAAETVADMLGWDEGRVTAEIAAYRDHLRRQHALRDGGERRSGRSSTRRIPERGREWREYLAHEVPTSSSACGRTPARPRR